MAHKEIKKDVYVNIMHNDVAGFTQNMTKLMDLGYEVDVPLQFGLPACIVAANFKSQTILTWLLEQGANPNYCVKYHEIIQAGIEFGDKSFLELLLQRSADINSCLQYAILENNVELVEFFLVQGANPLADLNE